VVGAVGGVIGVAAAVGFGVWTIYRARDQDEAQQRTEALAREALTTSQESVAVAKDAAESSRRSADEAAKVAAVEVAQHHFDLAPTQKTVPTYLQEGHPGTHRDLFGVMTLPKDYQVRAVAQTGNSTFPLNLQGLLRANEPHRFFIEKWPPDQTVPTAEVVILKLWPPTADDPVEQWSCGCGRPLTEGTDRDPGHWEMRLPLEPPPATPHIFGTWR